MSKKREAEIADELTAYRAQHTLVLVTELLSLRRERFRDRLERRDDMNLYAGKAQECKDLIDLLS